jgi:hypothetical protein
VSTSTGYTSLAALCTTGLLREDHGAVTIGPVRLDDVTAAHLAACVTTLGRDLSVLFGRRPLRGPVATQGRVTRSGPASVDTAPASPAAETMAADTARLLVALLGGER